jgi:tripartite-type tricarboxylate transporter receptor subunit TctC
LLIGIALAFVPLLIPASAHTQNYPTKPVRVLTAEAGGGVDLVARLIATGLSASFGQQFIVDNRPGSTIAGEIVSKAPPDGYTIMVYSGSLWLLPFMREHVPFDPVRDFSPIGLETNSPTLVTVHPALPVKSVKELIAYAKAKPGALDFSTGQVGSTSHLAAELFDSMAGVKMLRVPYKGAGPAMNALIAGEVQVMFASAGAAASHVKSGRVRALAVTSGKPSALFPDLPTVAASGLPGYECNSIIGAFAPAKVAPAIIARLSKEMAIAVNKPEIKQRFASSGVETIGSSPQELAATVKSEMARLGKLIKDIGVRDE